MANRERDNPDHGPWRQQIATLLELYRDPLRMGGTQGADEPDVRIGAVRVVQCKAGPAEALPPLVPTPCQEAILEVLDGHALRQDALETRTGYDRRQLQRWTGLKELRERGLVHHHKRLGYYRPDAPPPELTDPR